ncbi:hypothetical protein COMA2_110007 [Candidatus Nitrospira nitrificans]|uniref:Uncharacterized protein n=1 Tax=Candidatus Nitrospira nitrificans TaxID=1742973 RepID=A0A0S4L778_9BACT|nr:hypothetical protein COMA2_110007 [Candidatus Nitrospira nitrificans]
MIFKSNGQRVAFPNKLHDPVGDLPVDIHSSVPYSFISILASEGFETACAEYSAPEC